MITNSDPAGLTNTKARGISTYLLKSHHASEGFFGVGSNIGHCLFVGWVEHLDIFCWVSFLYPTFYEGCQVLFFIFFELAIPLDKPHLLLMSTQDPIYPFMP